MTNVICMYQGAKKSLWMAVSLLLMSAIASAQSGVEDLLNTYFLPQTVEVSGVLGLSFVVFSFVIVAVLLYIGMSRVFPEKESLVLSLAIAFFVIPSGGYKWISGMFIALFQLGGVQFEAGTGIGVDTGLIPFQIILPILVFISVAILMQYFGEDEFQTFEFLAASIAAFFTFLALDGGISALGAAFGWMVVFLFGMHVFGQGMGAGGILGYLIGAVGLFAVLWTFQAIPMFPESIQGFTKIVAGITAFIIVGIVALIILGAILVADKVKPGPSHPWNPL